MFPSVPSTSIISLWRWMPRSQSLRAQLRAQKASCLSTEAAGAAAVPAQVRIAERVIPLYGRTQRGQAVIEYAILVAAFIAAITAMAGYISRGISGRWRDTGDSIGKPYDPRNTSGHMTVSTSNDTTSTSTLQKDVPVDENQTIDVITTTTTVTTDRTSRGGSETVGPLPENLWDQQ